ncbi:MAG: TonB-dependent receptor [Bacteroidales bacterium]|nr:TonB-dependent receptor [Bacteroidales bacterium]
MKKNECFFRKRKIPGLQKVLRIMKLTAFLLLFSVISAFAGKSYSQTKRLNLSLDYTTVKEALQDIEEQSEFVFMYSEKLVDVNRKISIDMEDRKIAEILDAIFAGSNVTYSIKDRFILLATPEVTGNGISFQQPKSVAGTVTDEQGQPLPGVTVVVKGTTNGTITNAFGNYSLSHIPEDAVLIFSFVGMRSQEVVVGNQTLIDVTMDVTSIGIEEVVVVGYGTQKKVNLTGAVQNVTSNEIVKRNASNTSNAIQGLIPGVSVVQTSGNPGDGARITIRGRGSLNSSSSPLVLIDGVEGNMDRIDLNTIESISVLKDAASASIYGSRASNGVILVTTKRAEKGDLKVSYNGYVGVNSPTEMPDPVSAIEYMEAINVARANANMDPQYPVSLIDEYRTLGADNINRYETNWKKEIIKDMALTHNNSISISGGSERVRIFGNAGSYYQEGLIDNNEYEMLTLRMNTDVDITQWFKMGVDVNIRQSESVQPTLDSPETIISKATTFVPVFSGINADGSWGYGQNGDNPIATVKESGLNNARTPELGIRGFVTLTPVKGLNIMASYYSRRTENKSDYFLKPYDSYEGGVYKTTYPATGSQKYEGWSQDITNQSNIQALYEKELKDHSFKLLSGMQTEEIKSRNFRAARKGYEFDGFEDLNHGDVATAINNGSHWEWAMLSYYGRFNYSFKNRYLIEVNGRWDASSRFMKDSRWGFFPSISGGWRISEEKFWEPLVSSINNLKIRGSYGTLGNQSIYSYFPYAATISSGYGYWYDKELATGAAQTQVANEKISWEKSTQLNFGIEMGLFNSRLYLSYDYYVRTITDMLQQFPIPLYVGLSTPWENAGSMRNNGWDLLVTWRDKINSFGYHVNVILSDVVNEVTNLYGKEYVGTTITREGDPISSWYGYATNGYFQSQEEIDSSPVYGARANVKPGYIRYNDLSGPDGEPDGVINSFDRTIIGNSSPRYEYSVNVGADWKGLDLTLFLQGVGKKDIYYDGFGARPFYIGRTIFRQQLDYWTEENRDAKFPILLIDGSGSNPNNIISDFWVKSGAYLRLKNVVIGYTVPKSMLQRMNIEKLRLYLSGQNLLTVSDAYDGYDPENSVNSGSFYPLMRTITLGVDINF